MRFIELTDVKGPVILVNVAHVICLVPQETGTVVITGKDFGQQVKETPDEILLKIRG